MLPWFVENPDPEEYLGDNYVVIDFETTNRNFGSATDAGNRLLLACAMVGRGHRAYKRPGHVYSYWGGELEQGSLAELVSSSRFIVAHNTKFELGWLRRAGADLRKILPYDTMLGEYVIAGNRKFRLDLESTAGRYGVGHKSGACAYLIHEAGACPSDIPSGMLQEYCEQDVRLTHEVFLKQRQVLEEGDLLPVAYCRNLITPALTEMEFYGMRLDKERVLETYSSRSEAYQKKLEAFSAMTGGINPKSGKQMREYIYGAGKLGFSELLDKRGNAIKTSAGQAKTDKLTLAELEATTQEQKAFKALVLDLVKDKVPVQNLTKMKVILDSGKDTIRAGFNQAVTQTHRLSSSSKGGGFQFQNMDRAFKPLFRASEDNRLLVESDGAQLEFVVAGALANDAAVLNLITSGGDVHALTSEAYKCSRQDAKARTFRPLYGATGGSNQDKKYQKAFQAAYPAVFDMQTAWTHKVLAEGELRTPWGLKFYWPGTGCNDFGYVENTTSIFNYPIQSFATADIIPLVLVLIWHKIAGMDVKLVNTIHDSVLADVIESQLDTYRAILVDCFTKDIYKLLYQLYGIKFSMPLGVGIKAAKNWSEGKEEKFRAQEFGLNFNYGADKRT